MWLVDIRDFLIGWPKDRLGDVSHLFHYGNVLVSGAAPDVSETVGSSIQISGGMDGPTWHNTFDSCLVSGIVEQSMPRQQSSWGHHGAHLQPTGPMWAPCWPHEPCYQGGLLRLSTEEAQNDIPYYTGWCHYKVLSYNMMFHTAVQWLWHYINQFVLTIDTP